MDGSLAAAMAEPATKPPILQESVFSVEEGALYRGLRTGAIWMNKLFFGALALLAVWLLMGLTGAVEPGCVSTIAPMEGPDGHADGETQQCSVFLSTTAKYLGAMAAISFTLSVAFGLLGLVVGKRILEMTPRDEEVAAKKIEEMEKSSDRK